MLKVVLLFVLCFISVYAQIIPLGVYYTRFVDDGKEQWDRSTFINDSTYLDDRFNGDCIYQMGVVKYKIANDSFYIIEDSLKYKSPCDMEFAPMYLNTIKYGPYEFEFTDDGFRKNVYGGWVTYVKENPSNINRYFSKPQASSRNPLIYNAKGRKIKSQSKYVHLIKNKSQFVKD